MYNNLFNNPEKKITSTAHKGLLSLTLNNKLALDKSQLTPQIIDFLKERLNLISTEYLTKKRLGKSVYSPPNLEPVQFASNIKLFPEQSRVVEQAIQNACGVIVAPSGQEPRTRKAQGGKEESRAIRSNRSGRRRGGGNRVGRRSFSSAIRRSEVVKEQCEYLRRA